MKSTTNVVDFMSLLQKSIDTRKRTPAAKAGKKAPAKKTARKATKKAPAKKAAKRKSA
jgi:DNA end-binding protein Ku